MLWELCPILWNNQNITTPEPGGWSWHRILLQFFLGLMKHIDVVTIFGLISFLVIFCCLMGPLHIDFFVNYSLKKSFQKFKNLEVFGAPWR